MVLMTAVYAEGDLLDLAFEPKSFEVVRLLHMITPALDGHMSALACLAKQTAPA
ncbi:MAG: hypothetical protein ACJ789_18415 [Thermomicrobiales bacterium]